MSRVSENRESVSVQQTRARRIYDMSLLPVRLVIHQLYDTVDHRLSPHATPVPALVCRVACTSLVFRHTPVPRQQMGWTGLVGA